MKKRRIYEALLAAAMTASLLAGCGGKQAETKTGTETGTEAKVESQTTAETPSASSVLEATVANTEESAAVGEVAVAVGYDISDLSPWSSATSGRLCVLPTIYEYMAYYDASQECGMSGILMKDYEKVDDLTSKVTIYDSIYDSAGNHLTAEDVAFSFLTWKENGKSVKCKLLDSCSVVDDYTVEIKLTSDTVGDVENMLCGLIPIVTKAAYEASGDGMIENVISTAPYIVKEYVSGSHLIVEKNENYWQKDESLILPVSRANAEKITFKIITEKSQIAINLETNSVDITSALNYGEAARFEEGGESAGAYTPYQVRDTNFYWITFNCSEGGMFEDNLALRQAVAYGIDAQGLVTGILNGKGEVMKAYGNQVCVDYNKAWDTEAYYEYDMEKAKQLLLESGFDTGRSIRIMTPSAAVNSSASQIIQSYLMQLGLKCELLTYDSALFQTYKTDPSQWDIMLDSKQSVDYVTSLASTLVKDGESRPFNFVKDDKMQELALSVATVGGHTEEGINEYMEYIKDQCYVYSLFLPYNYYVAENTVTNVFTNFKGWLVPGACTFSEEFTR